MLAGFSKNHRVRLALQIFDEMVDRDIVSWNLMLDKFVQLGDIDSAWDFFRRIPDPGDYFVWVDAKWKVLGGQETL